MALISVYVTSPSMEEARRIAKHLLDKRLVACANHFPISSDFLWDGRLRSEEEVVSLLKTVPENWERVRDEIAHIHPDKVPCILRYAIEASDGYEDWVRDSTDS